MAKKTGKSKIYFSQLTEDAIIKYNKSTDQFERDQIFNAEIYPAFDKLAENVINRFKFPYIEESFEDIKHEVVAFLVLNLHKFTENKGKAFSYFSVIAKNYLILHNNTAYKENLKSVYISSSDSDEAFNLEETLVTTIDSETPKNDAQEFISLLVQYWDFNLTKIFKKKKELEIANAVIELLRRSNTIENFNKKALYLLIREMTDQKTINITKVINKMKIHVYKQMDEYRRTGYLSDPSVHFVYKPKK